MNPFLDIDLAMIISQLLGGLGNQMFQYAFGRSLAERNKVGLKLDTKAFASYKLHSYGLNHLCIKSNLATNLDILLTVGAAGTIGKIIDRTPFGLKKRRLIEPSFEFSPACLNFGPNAYVQGYWQSEKYFLPIEDIIRKELSVSTAPDVKNTAMLEVIKGYPSVALHIRRGDYVSNQGTNNYHGTCSLSYYREALEFLKNKVGDFRVFVFSDDPAWVKHNLISDRKTTYIDFNDAAKNYEDLRLMYSCQHQVIANSTFSWWGAWLNPNPDKIIVAPKLWFKDQTLNTTDLIPEAWVRF